MNRAQIKLNSIKAPKAPYELSKCRLAIFKVFGSKCYINIKEDNLGKFDSRTDGDFFLFYGSGSKVYKCYNKKICKVVEIGL